MTVKAPFTLTDGLLSAAETPWISPSGSFTLQPVTGTRKRARSDHSGSPIEIHPTFCPKQKPRAARAQGK